MLSVDGIPSENGIFQEVSQEVKNLQEDIKTGKFKNAYLLFGEEAYLKIQYKEKLIHALNPDDDTMNFTKYEGKGIEVREMIDLCETMPFFADHRVVLVENSGFFKNKCDELADYMKTLPDYLRLVFVEEEVDKRSRMYKAVKNCGRIVEFAKQDEKTLMRWAAGILAREGRKITTRDMELFLTKTGTDMGNIRMELDKLPKMSTIVMEGEQIQMVGLTIPYIKESFYKEKMSAYIDDIVHRSDALGPQEEKIRFIRQQLAWKRLFSVIVTDMNAIRLTLYKRERISSQSRYLKYEEAVGSTGQSQGIYIQFLIAVIHYISAIHAGTASGERLKKVLFIDNPFGAAKDIYIWEPIFALLKTNDVQLIVPARGATPAITGKFDVNYVLGQKLMNHRQQTIVVDYHSNVTIDEMEYVKINYEQEVFDFV